MFASECDINHAHVSKKWDRSECRGLLASAQRPSTEESAHKFIMPFEKINLNTLIKN